MHNKTCAMHKMIIEEDNAKSNGWSTKRKVFVAAVVIFLVATIAILAVLLRTLVFNEKIVSSEQRQSVCGGIPCVHGSCHCGDTEKICVCYANYTGDSCDTLKQPDCGGDDKCLRQKGPPPLDKGWHSPGVEYEYLLTKAKKSWEEARTICKQYGGDLAAHGIRNRATRIAAALQLYGGLRQRSKLPLTWIGLKREDGRWSWVNGDRPYNVYWLPDQPNQKTDSNCAVIDGYVNDYSTENYECDRKFRALCEKRVS